MLLVSTFAAACLAADESTPRLDQSLLINCVLTNYLETPFVENVVAAVTTKAFSSGGVSIPAGAEVRGLAVPGDRIIAAKDVWELRWRDAPGGPERSLSVKAEAFTNIVPRRFPATTPKAGIGGYAVEPGPTDDILVFFGLAEDYRGAPKRIKAPVGTVFALQLDGPLDITAVRGGGTGQ